MVLCIGFTYFQVIFIINMVDYYYNKKEGNKTELKIHRKQGQTFSLMIKISESYIGVLEFKTLHLATESSLLLRQTLGDRQ